MRLRPWQRHSLVLAVAGLVYLLIGVLFFVTPITDDRRASLELALRLMPMHIWGVVWCLVGGLAFASTRWPPQSKTWGYTAMTGLSAAWGSTYLLGIILLGSPATGLTGAVVWYLLAFLWWAISGLVNPDDIPKAG